ncbi:MAG: hypothetical protein OSB38_15135 [Paraburkholderia fungorum]|nr:hypothetical protein [Paraburkholderia fungorum]
MQASQTPTLVPLAFAANGTKNTIPETSQIGITPGAASLNDGFPPLTFTPIAAGGVPPAGADVNGVLNLITQSIRWAHGGGGYAWNSAFTTDANVAGYPNGAELNRADLTGFWINTVDGNETNPDAVDGSAAGWVPGYNYGVYAVTGLTNANVTLFPLQAAKNKITLAGALTGNVQIIFPAWTKEWVVVNNTTGAFTVTAKTASGTGIVLAAGQQKITGDGTNITQPPESIAAATQPQHAMPLGQATGRLLRVIRYASSTTPSYLAATTQVLAKGRGGGGGSASAAATGANQVSVGGPGGQGAYFETLITSGFVGQPVTVGAGGAGGTGGSVGSRGGTSSFMGASATGGFGGGSSGASTTSAVAGAQNIATASGGTISNVNGGGGSNSFAVAATGAQFGSGGAGGGDTQPGAAGNIPGSGGGGVAQTTASSGAIPGLAGAAGYVEIWEYA